MEKRGVRVRLVLSLLVFTLLASIVSGEQVYDFGFQLSSEVTESHNLPAPEEYTKNFPQPVVLTRFDAYGYSFDGQQPTYSYAVAFYQGVEVARGSSCFFRYADNGGSFYSRCGAFTPHTLVDRVSLLEQYPERQTSLESYTLNYLRSLDQRQATVSLADQRKDFGAAHTFNISGVSTVFVGSDNPQILIGFGPSLRSSTSDFSEHLFACLDLNTNQQCDFIEAQACITAGKDWSSTTGLCVDNSQCTAFGGVWLASLQAGSRCCGDSPSDAGIITGDAAHGPFAFLCIHDSVRWQWLPADQQDFLIKGFTRYDVVSNGERWFQCAPSAGSDVRVAHYQGITPPSLGFYAERARSAKFLCADRSGASRFLECCVPGIGDERACQNSGSARAGVGASATDLVEGTISKTFITPDDILSLSSLLIQDWGRASSLSLVYNLSSPAPITIELFSGSQLLFSGDLAAFVTDSSETSHSVFARIPLSPYTHVSNVRFHFIAPSSSHFTPIQLTVDRMWLTLRDEGDFFCSGSRYLEGVLPSVWIRDLDNTIVGFDGQPAGKSVCTAIPAFGWTGARCCGDDGLPPGFESSLDIIGGCWRGVPVFEGTTTQNGSVLFYDHQFWACPSSTFLDIPMIQNGSFCTVKGSFFCSPISQRWSTESELGYTSSQRTTLKNASVFGTSSQSCCPSDRCWNGSSCIANMAGDSTTLPFRDYRCVAGDWVYSPLVFTWDARQSGYCPRPTQCLVDTSGNAHFNDQPLTFFHGLKPQCIANGQSILDHYCSRGNWTSRTKLLALNLLSLVNLTGIPNHYTLYCDDYNSSLVDFSYSSVLDYIVGPKVGAFRQPCIPGGQQNCVNNFCLLQYTDRYENIPKRVVGVSLNKPINDPQSSFLYALGELASVCDLVNNTMTFQQCGTSTRLWYNPALASLIYSREGVSFSGPSFFDVFLSWLSNPLQAITSWLQGSHYSHSFQSSYNFTQSISQFQRLYLSEQGDKKVYAIYDDVGVRPFIFSRYSNISPSLCSYIQNKAVVHGINQNVTVTSIVCTTTGDTASVFTDDPSSFSLWQELTSKIRVT